VQYAFKKNGRENDRFLKKDASLLGTATVNKSGFFNSCITKRCLHNSTKLSHAAHVLKLLNDRR
jgi:hypothetical protein